MNFVKKLANLLLSMNKFRFNWANKLAEKRPSLMQLVICLFLPVYMSIGIWRGLKDGWRSFRDEYNFQR